MQRTENLGILAYVIKFKWENKAKKAELWLEGDQEWDCV